jgi:hypothetical protein
MLRAAHEVRRSTQQPRMRPRSRAGRRPLRGGAQARVRPAHLRWATARMSRTPSTRLSAAPSGEGPACTGARSVPPAPPARKSDDQDDQEWERRTARGKQVVREGVRERIEALGAAWESAEPCTASAEDGKLTWKDERQKEGREVDKTSSKCCVAQVRARPRPPLGPASGPPQAQPAVQGAVSRAEAGGRARHTLDTARSDARIRPPSAQRSPFLLSRFTTRPGPAHSWSSSQEGDLAQRFRA